MLAIDVDLEIARLDDVRLIVADFREQQRDFVVARRDGDFQGEVTGRSVAEGLEHRGRARLRPRGGLNNERRQELGGVCRCHELAGIAAPCLPDVTAADVDAHLRPGAYRGQGGKEKESEHRERGSSGCRQAVQPAIPS